MGDKDVDSREPQALMERLCIVVTMLEMIENATTLPIQHIYTFREAFMRKLEALLAITERK
jgi:hypothetical protein